MTHALIPERVLPGRRLGRHLNHDDRSRNYPARTAATLTAARHRHYGPALDQGRLGSCTGNAIAQALNTVPLHTAGRLLHEPDAVDLYSRATLIDPYPGAYPPDDTGSDGLSACKAAAALGYITGYRWAFGADDALAALVLAPVIAGTVWTTGMDDVDADGYVQPRIGSVRGGHEYAVVAIDPRHEYVEAVNSWGPSWGRAGRFRLRFADLDWLLAQGGDVAVPEKG